MTEAHRIAMRRQRPRDLLPDNHAPKRRGDNRINSRIREQSGQRLPQFFRESRVLQDQRALHVRAAVEAARQLKMPVADRSRLFKKLQ